MVDTIETFAPMFPGFYNTIYGPDTEHMNYDFNQYRKEICIAYCEHIGNFLIENKVVVSMKFKALYSPKEYNFTTDSINVKLQISTENRHRISQLINENWESFTEYIKEKFTSCSGFTSFWSSDSEVWRTATNDFLFNGEEDYVTSLGVVLEYLCESEFCFNEEENDIYERCNAHEILEGCCNG